MREVAARRAGEGYGPDPAVPAPAIVTAGDAPVRERAKVAREFDPAEARHGRHTEAPPAWSAVPPIAGVAAVSLAVIAPVPPRLDTAFPAEGWPRDPRVIAAVRTGRPLARRGRGG